MTRRKTPAFFDAAPPIVVFDPLGRMAGGPPRTASLSVAMQMPSSWRAFVSDGGMRLADDAPGTAGALS